MDNGGISVLHSFAEEAEKFNQEMKELTQEMMQDLCADWDASAAGTPQPKEWNCPGY
jgi:hypothetical protein